MQLIDLGKAVSFIPIEVAKVPYTFSIKLDDKTYSFLIRYNDQGGFSLLICLFRQRERFCATVIL